MNTINTNTDFRFIAEDAEQLNSFLRGELSAVETYQQAIESIDDQPVVDVLRQCHDSHVKRVDALSSAIEKLGHSPAKSSGVWGTFANAVTGGAKLFGDTGALKALEQGEQHGLADYQRETSGLTERVQNFVRSELIPRQETTCATIAAVVETS